MPIRSSLRLGAALSMSAIIAAACLSSSAIAGADTKAEYPAYAEMELYATDFRGEEAPDLDAEFWIGKRPKTKDKVVMVEFWATWCGPCKDSIPKLNKWHKKYGDDLVIIGMSDERRNEVEPFAKKMGMRYAVASDTNGRMKRELGVRGIPNAFIVSSDGIVRWQGLPWDLNDDTIEQIIAANKAAVAGDDVASMSGSKDEGMKSRKAIGAEYPEFDRKARFQARDLRGKQGPRIEVAKWMNEEPDLEDKVVVLEFWATWCGPCVKIIPHVNKLHKRYKDDVAFINVSAENENVVRDFMKKTPMEMYVAIDPNRRMSGKIRNRTIPHAIVMSSDGVVRWQGHPAQLKESTLKQIIAANHSDLERTASAEPAGQRYEQ